MLREYAYYYAAKIKKDYISLNRNSDDFRYNAYRRVCRKSE